MSGGVSSLLRGCDTRGGVCSPVVGAEAQRVRFSKAPWPLNACPVSKHVAAEAGEAHMVTVNPGTAHAGVRTSAQQQPKAMSLSLLCSSQA